MEPFLSLQLPALPGVGVDGVDMAPERPACRLMSLVLGDALLQVCMERGRRRDLQVDMLLGEVPGAPDEDAIIQVIETGVTGRGREGVVCFPTLYAAALERRDGLWQYAGLRAGLFFAGGRLRVALVPRVACQQRARLRPGSR